MNCIIVNCRSLPIIFVTKIGLLFMQVFRVVFVSPFTTHINYYFVIFSISKARIYEDDIL